MSGGATADLPGMTQAAAAAQVPPFSDERPPTDPKRLRSFATFFKNYMSVSAVLTAAAPIPVALFDLIPQYDAIRRLTTTIASLLAFLSLAYIFFNRASLGRAWFGSYLLKGSLSAREYEYEFSGARARFRARGVAALPLFLIVMSIASLAVYLVILELSNNGNSDRLARADYGYIRFAAPLMFTLVGFYVLAEAAFIVMALREYTQDLLGITDKELILNTVKAAGSEDPIVRNAAHLVATGRATITSTGDYSISVRDLRIEYDYQLDRKEFEAALAAEQERETTYDGAERASPEIGS